MAYGKSTGDDLAREARELLEDDWQSDQDNRKEASRDLDFAAGNQWPGDVAREREANHRPTLTINRMPQFINQVVNDFRINAPGIMVSPVDSRGDPELADIYNGMLRAIQYASNATHVWSAAFHHAVMCGIGHFRVVADYSGAEDFDQELYVKRINNPLSVYWDAVSMEPDRSDAQHCFVTEMISKRVYKERFKGASESSFEMPDIGPHGFSWSSMDAVRVAEYWKKVPEKRKLARMETGEVLDITGLKQNDLVYLPPILEVREIDSHRVEHCLVNGCETLEKTTKWPGRWIPIIPVIGQEIPLGDTMMRHGLIRFARDPQQLYNFWRSAAAESIALAPRAPYLVTPTMIGEFKGQWDSHNQKNRPYLLYKPDPDAPGGRPVREMPPDIPQALLQESAIASDDMKATTGIYDAGLGARSNETSGRAISARQREGDVSTYHFRDNFNVSLTHCGRVLIDLIPKIYDTERVVRLMKEESEKPDFVKVNQQVMSDNGVPTLRNDLNAGKFDVRVKLGPSYTTRRQESADSMIQFVQAFPQAGQIAGDLVAKAMDWPDADKFAERFRRSIPAEILGEDAEEMPPEAKQAQAQQQQLAQLAMQLDLEQKRLANEKTEAETHDKRASAVEKEITTLIQMLQVGLGAQPQPQPQTFAASRAMPRTSPAAPAQILPSPPAGGQAAYQEEDQGEQDFASNALQPQAEQFGAY